MNKQNVISILIDFRLIFRVYYVSMDLSLCFGKIKQIFVLKLNSGKHRKKKDFKQKQKKSKYFAIILKNGYIFAGLWLRSR